MDTRKHPTPADRLRHFLSTVEDYERLDRAIPLGRSINLFGHLNDDERRWHVVLHALLLRKYFADPGVRMSEVMSAARQCEVNGGPPGADWDAMIANVEQMESGVGSRFGDNPHTFSNAELYYAQLYGRLLHGDFDKWKTTIMAGDEGLDTAVFSTTASRADRVLSLANWLREEAQAGRLEY
jgi:hypothetical protein